ncbi:cytoplasmic dynein 2 light intermediate chain 1-like [Brachionus plicatilis]|uniref:Cytoplasmic dynein 2 light intermediate chain 1 n=1 Tax=Brachionus plicatilis TaxID=10195 RepID=A0A3M7P2W4_BRAPC|nr:cytoplasmic dynein 2 light intermediate chain 1-like [Brachionus plicatilis]
MANDRKYKEEVDEPTTSRDAENLTRILLWNLAAEKVRDKEISDKGETSEEKNLIFVGSRESGKSSIILNYTDRSNETSKPTIALDYTFCRKAKSGSSVLKNVGHIFELGEGTFLLKLIDVVVNPENILNTSVIITVDLSKLSEMWITLETVIAYLKARIKECVKEANRHDPTIKDQLKKAIQQRLSGNPDESKLEPIALPTAIVASKYDIFEKYEPEKQKIISKTLRFVAHYFGASLIFSSNRNETSAIRLKSMMNNFLLDGSITRQAKIETSKPIFVTFGADTFESIGLPPLSASELNDPSHKTLLDLWKYLFCRHFPQEESKKDPSLLEDFGRDPQFEESSVDILREQKMKELENLREILVKRRQNTQTTSIQIIN